MNFTIFMDQLKDLRSTKYKYLLGAFVIFALVVYKHRSNIVRLMNHTENKLDFAKINKLSSRKKDK